MCGGAGGAELFAAAFPDAEPAGCCIGEAVYGLEGCTCWAPVYDTEQSAPVVRPAHEAVVRPGGRCGDCAYRRDSPENADPFTAEDLVTAAISGRFWCHDGMRRPRVWVHPGRPGVKLPGSAADWRPAVVGDVPYRADGSQALLCAGWAAEGRRQARILEAELSEAAQGRAGADAAGVA